MTQTEPSSTPTRTNSAAAPEIIPEAAPMHWGRYGLMAVAIAVPILIFAWVNQRATEDRRVAQARVMEKMKQGKADMSALVDQASKGEDVTSQIKEIDRQVKLEISENGAYLNERDKVVAEAISTFNMDVQTRVALYNTRCAAFVALGGSNPRGLDSIESIDRRLSSLEQVEAVNVDLISYAEKISVSLPQDLLSKGVPEAQMQLITKPIQMEMESLIEFRKVDQKLIADMKAILMLLKAEFGKWEVNGVTRIGFQSPKASDQYWALQESIRKDSQEETRLQQKADADLKK